MNSENGVGPATVPVLEKQVEQILAEAKKQGATACEVAVSTSQSLAVTVRQKEVETLEFNRDQGFGITLYVGQRKASASTTATDAKAIQETVAAALEIAKHTSEDDCAGLAEPEQMAKDLPDLELFYPWDITPEQAINTLLECEAAAFTTDKRITNADGTSLNTWNGCRVYGNSNGFIGGYASTNHSISCVMIGEENGQMQRDYWYDVKLAGEQLESATAIGKKAAHRTIERLGARTIPTCEVPVIFAAEVASGLFGHLLGAISGGSIYRKTSFLEGAIGKQLFPSWLSITEKPRLKATLNSTSFDGDGLATYDKLIIDKGQLMTYLLSVYSGRKLGLPSTANAGGCHNLFVSHGADNLIALLKQMGKGLLVTELMGSGINMVTGDYSRGAAGFWVENGEIQFPVQEVTVAGNLKDMFTKIVAIGNDIDPRRNIKTGSVLIEKMAVAGS
ncbi:metalloprotease PmbA [Entomomonas sp. E2T0]|uniref:metalloprotease PmbA n=1 Tax=Entomomonas sp. E2T0 TaxID=2930213 RepID=UPI0022280E44|nr:metalloprotease PmbA [Entomomonas sp. E2T0]UYZ85029.1 metalloprotease PmbA [Entomomonas sp. E2T0]